MKKFKVFYTKSHCKIIRATDIRDAEIKFNKWLIDNDFDHSKQYEYSEELK